jgi:phasin family protein
MTNSIFDPKTIFENYRTAFAPVLKAQQEGVKALERLGRYQYAVAGDYLEWILTQAKATVGTTSPTEFFAKQTELGSALSEKLRNRGQELATIASEAQTTLTQLVSEAAAQASAILKKAA